MIKVKFIKGKVTEFDDVEYSYEVKDRMHTYIVTITFCGAIEDGEDSDTLYENVSFEKCVCWCINS